MTVAFRALLGAAGRDAGGGGGGYRYHRLAITANNGRSTINIAEVELRESIGGANAATGGTASASTVFSGSFPASAAFDANASTYWASETLGASASAKSEHSSTFNAIMAFDSNTGTFWSTAVAVTSGWLRRDLGPSGATTVTSYRITARADAADGSPKDWTLEYSDDDSSWSTADTVTGETGWSNGETRTYNIASVGPHRYWRLNITANNGRSTINIAELELLGDTLGATLQYDQGAGNTIAVAQYAIQARADANDGSPKDWTFEGSNDAETWTVLDTVTGETGWSNGETRTFTV